MSPTHSCRPSLRNSRARRIGPTRRQPTRTFTRYLVAEGAGGYWLLDEVPLLQPYNKRVTAEAVQVFDRSGLLNPILQRDCGVSELVNVRPDTACD
jgi:hypothetical protein